MLDNHQFKIARRMTPMSKLIKMIAAFLLIIACTPGAYADIPPPQMDAAIPAAGIAAVLVAVAIVFAGLWWVARMKRVRQEKELLAAGGSLPSATSATSATRAVK
jgi:hypothetical protein